MSKLAKILVTVGVVFLLTFVVHFILWKNVFHLDEMIIIKFYGFLSLILLFLITIILIVNRIVPEFVGLFVIALIILKFGMMYLVWKKLNFIELFDDFSKPYVVVTFLSVLEMAKNKEIIIKQDNNFSDIYLERVD